MDAHKVLQTIETVLVIDWPSRDVPEALVRAGFHVVVRGGPGPQDYSVYELTNGEVISSRLGHLPERADLIYCYRPLSELPEMIATARKIQANTIWTQSGFSAAGVKDAKGCWMPEDELRAAESLVSSAGLNFFSQPYIGDLARTLHASA